MNKLFKNFVKKFAKRNFYNGLSRFLTPISFVRTQEISNIINISGILNKRNEKLRILDISSPQILSCFLASFSSKWSITYVNPFEDELNEITNYKHIMNIKNIVVQYADLLKPSTLDFGKFNYIFSCSVIEHIHPEEDGDTKGIINVTNLLQPNGAFIFSVPIARQHFNEYKNDSVYHIKKNNTKNIFFQRFYDWNSLNNRLLRYLDLELTDSLFIGERYYFPNNYKYRVSKLFENRVLSLIFGRVFWFISKLFLHTSADLSKLNKPYIAILKMEKK